MFKKTDTFFNVTKSIDTKKNVKRFFDYYKPEIGIFVRYDFWWGYIQELSTRDIPFYVISLRLKEGGYLSKSYGKAFRDLLFTARHIFTLEEGTEALVNSFGYENTSVCGDTRFDRVAMLSTELPDFKEFDEFKEKYREVIVCGSTWHQDEESIIPILNDLDLGVIIAPHEVDEEHVCSIEKRLRISSIRYSQIDKYIGEQAIIIDNVGLLSRLYSLGSYAYVGGAFKTGLHNILEPMSFGIPVVFGPNYEKFPEAIETLTKGFSFSISTSSEFLRSIQTAREEDSKSNQIKAYISDNQGGSEKILNLVFKEER